MSKHFMVYQKSTGQIVTEHFADKKGLYPDFADATEWLEIEIPLDAVVSYLRVVENNGAYTITEDLQKKQAYLREKWSHTMDTIRDKRNYLLQNSDWTQMNDSPLSDAQKLAWKKYRQQLRDITKGLTINKNSNIVWPNQPK